MCLFTTIYGNISIGVTISNGQRYVLRKGNSPTKVESVSIDFDLGNVIHLNVLEGVEHIEAHDYIVLLLELDI